MHVRTHFIRCYSSVDPHAHAHSFSLQPFLPSLLRGEVHLPSSVVYGSESMPSHPSCATSPSIPGVLENKWHSLAHTHVHMHTLHGQHSMLTLSLCLFSRFLCLQRSLQTEKQATISYLCSVLNCDFCFNYTYCIYDHALYCYSVVLLTAVYFLLISLHNGVNRNTLMTSMAMHGICFACMQEPQ